MARPSMEGLATTRLQDQANLAFGQNVTFPVKGQLEPGRLVAAVRLVLDAVFTQPAAGMVVQYGEVLRQMITRISIGRRVSISGLGAFFLDWMDLGRTLQFPGDVPAVASASYAKRIEWAIQFHRPASSEHYDGCIPTELFDEMIQAPLATSGIFGPTVPTLSGATMRCYIDTLPGPKEGFDVPTSYRIFDQPFAALNAQVLVPGAYEHAALFTNTANSRNRLTSANVSSVTTRADGRPLFVNARAEDIAALWNRHVATGSTRGSSSPVYNAPAEAIDDQPDQAAAAAQASNQLEFLPLVFTPQGYTADDLAKVKNGLAVDLAGTIGAYMIACRVREPRDASHVKKAGMKAGAEAGQIVSTLHPETVPFGPIHIR